jgi:hypothetical protein
MVNFCLYVFIIYGVAGSVGTILFGSRRKKRRGRAAAHRGKIIKLNTSKKQRRVKTRRCFAA